MAETKVQADGKLSLGTKLGFGVADMGGNLFFTAMGFWTLIYLTDVAGLSAAWAGVAILISKFWDAANDPLMGFITDRTRSRWGRRRPWLLIGSLPLLLATWAFFSAPAFKPDAQVASFLWATAGLFLLNTAFTMVNVPYGALTPELTKDYHEKTVLNGFRFGFAVVGTICGAAAVQPIAAIAGGDKKLGFSLVGLVFGLIMGVTTLITFFSVKEPPLPAVKEKPEGFISSYGRLFKDKHYLILLISYALHITGLSFVQVILSYYFKYVLGAEGLTAIAMLALLLVAMAFVPVSVPLSKRIGKKRTYQLSLLIIGAAALLISALGHILGPVFVIIVMVFAGVGMGFSYVPPFAMLPDTVEIEVKRSGKRNDGAYYGMWTLTSTLGVTFAGAMIGFILDASGYVADAVQLPSALLAIRLVFGPIAAVFLALGILVVQRYPVDEAYYARAMGMEGGAGAGGAAKG